MELQEYLGTDLINEIKTEAIAKAKELNKGNISTKAALAVELKLENEMLKGGLKHVINALDETGAELEVANKKEIYFKEKFGDVDKEFFDKHKPVAMLTENKSYARGRLVIYTKAYNENKNECNKNKSS
jgi:hypothetical protein